MFIGAIVFLRVIGGIGVLCILVSIDEPQKKRGCVKMNTLSFLHKAPTFSSQGFAIS